MIIDAIFYLLFKLLKLFDLDFVPLDSLTIVMELLHVVVPDNDHFLLSLNISVI